MWLLKHRLQKWRLLISVAVIVVLYTVLSFIFTQPDFRPGLATPPQPVSTRQSVTESIEINTKLTDQHDAVHQPVISTESSETSGLFPQKNFGEDRILAQLNYIPPGNITSTKTVLLWNSISSWGVSRLSGSKKFTECPVNRCQLTTQRADFGRADLVIFRDHIVLPKFPKPQHQLWMVYLLESPYYSSRFRSKSVDSAFDWTATYRSDSVVTAPYEKWVYNSSSDIARPEPIDYSAGKSRQVVAFISHCQTPNNRLGYARDLAKHIEVDIYGSCGEHKCLRSKGDACFESIIKPHYFFYLAFENSNCRDYITEKFFVNGLQYNAIPVVMGAHPDDYARSAPPNSFIHVDHYKSAADLAKYLRYLSSNPTEFNKYFAWKGTGTFIDTKFFCRVCALLHYPGLAERGRMSQFSSMEAWWRSPRTCIKGSWLR